MSGSKSRRPKAATVEDFDEDSGTTLPGSKTSANVAVKRTTFESDSPISPLRKHSHEGSDSGYSSKATTNTSMASDRRKKEALKINTAVEERERKPYSHPAPVSRSASTSVRPKATGPPQEAQSNKKNFVHEKGICWLCDTYGSHVDLGNDPYSATAAPPSPKTTRSSTSKAKDDNTERPTRRPSASTSRPVSWYGPPVQPATTMPYAFPVMFSPVYEAPPTPTYAYQPIAAPTYAYSYAPSTPITPNMSESGYHHPEPNRDYYRPSQPSRRSSSNAKEGYVRDPKPSKTRTSEVSSAREKQVNVVSHKPSKSHEDRIAMPPPPRPSGEAVVHRPQPGRSQTYNSSASSRRHSQYLEDDGIVELQSSHVQKEKVPSPTRPPPSSYRGPPNAEHHERPQGPGKSRSYTQGTVTAEVAGTRQQHLSRRTTTGSVPFEQKEAEAEEYQRLKGSKMVNDFTDLTAENLKRVPKHSVHKSEAGSAASRMSHHSSSKGSSSGRGRPASIALSRGSKTNINVNGVSVSIPENFSETQGSVKIDLGPVTISMGSKDKENFDATKEQKRIERAPSNASKASRRSTTSSTAVRRDRDDDHVRELPRESIRRPSYLDEDQRDAFRGSAKSSRQHSRTGSSARGSIDYGRRDPGSIGNSRDYSPTERFIDYAA